MTKEEKFVVNPLEAYLLKPKRSGATWTTKGKPKHGVSERGWDLQVARKAENSVLLIEAKYIRGASFASFLSDLTLSPLPFRPEKMKRDLYRSRNAHPCWAIGSGRKTDKHDMTRVYRNLFDYFARNVEFWKCYSRTLKVKFIFFVKDGKVAKVKFLKMVSLSERYDPSLADDDRTKVAAKLMKRFQFI